MVFSKTIFTLVALSLAMMTMSVHADGVALDNSSTARVGCAAELGGYHFNLHELSLPIDE